MPIVRIDVSDRRSSTHRQAISAGIHAALVDAVGVPEDDRFHLITVHPAEDLIAHPDYLGVQRQDVIYIQITLVQGRPPEMKQHLYRSIAAALGAIDGVRNEDVCVILTENGPVDYSWGNGEAQLLSLGPIPGVVA